MFEKGQLLELYLLENTLLRVQPTPVPETVEKVLTAFARFGRDAVKVAADAVVELLLAQRVDLLHQLRKIAVNDVHDITPLLKHIAAFIKYSEAQSILKNFEHCDSIGPSTAIFIGS